MNERIERLRVHLEPASARTFLISDPVNVRYLTGFESSNAVLLVGAERSTLVTDGRYVEAARAVGGIEVVQGERDLAAYVAARLEELAEPPFAFEADHLTVAQYQAIADSGAELVPTNAVVRNLRAVKDEEELDAVRRAARILTDALERFAAEDVAGWTEAEAAWWLQRAIREEGADAVSFEVIVASGPNAALPHHHPGVREIERGETLVVDAGARVDGYCSDCTRTFATGPLPDELKRAYAVCRAAQETALGAVHAGASARELDGIARREIQESGIAEAVHGLGHGVGLEIHELPRLSDTSEDTLVAGNVVTVEPGVYLPGIGGIRIEDLVIVTDDVPEVLTPFRKELLTL